MRKLIINEATLDLDESDLAQELYTQMVNSHGWKKGHWTAQSNLAYCVYVASRTDPPQGVLSQFVQDENIYPEHFQRFLVLSQPHSLLDTQFLLEFYRRYFTEETSYSEKGLSPWEALCEMRFKPNLLLDGLLADSRGLIVWDHQYDQLLQFMGPDWKDPPDMRRRLGLQSGRLWQEFQSATIDGRRLQEMIQERAIFRSTRNPSLPGTLALWKALQ